MQENLFSKWFENISGRSPFPYQVAMAESDCLPDALNVITGAGKTLAIIMAWVWRSLLHPNPEIRKTTPRRLVIVLPMRTLVEQTFDVAEKCLKKAGLGSEIGLHLLMGGAIDINWELYPERRAILIGTQDQLLSRALNRGYSMSSFKWPIHYGILNNDCLWVFDEVQLMGVGLKTSTQLQGFREKFGSYGNTRSLWVSATMKPEQLQTIDFQGRELSTLKLSAADRAHPVLCQRIQAQKVLCKAETIFDGKEPDYAKKLAQEVWTAHQARKLTLVVINKVSRARAVYQALKKLAGDDCPLRLIHSRFRLAERRELSKVLLKPELLSGILVTTQAVEAGVDISAFVLFTELTTWWSFIQRVGRCNRYGEDNLAKVFWINIDLKKKNVSQPYEVSDLERCRQELEQLTDVGAVTLETVEVPSPEILGNLLRRTDLLQLFDTSEDLAGHTIDVSSFIRDTKETDVGIVWRRWAGEKPADDLAKFEQDEICRVNRFSKESMEFLKDKRSLWLRNEQTNEWEHPPENLHSGMVLLVHCDQGGYDAELGFTGNSGDQPSPVDLRINEQEDFDGADRWTQIGKYITVTQHANDVAEEVTIICQELVGWELPVKELISSGRWHDQGKAHQAFQDMLGKPPHQRNPELWAKSDNLQGRMAADRRGFRHELVSALCALATGQSFLLAYLVAAHHGKVRMQIQPRPNEKPPDNKELRYALGVRDGDRIPPVDLGAGINTPEITIDLSCMELGGGQSEQDSWAQRAAELLAEYGPFKLALLESIIRIADIRVSKRYQQSVEDQSNA
jgi:CRISPR-associated endonuclease/helicase Cas3